MKTANAPVHVFKIRNRRGYAAVCCDNLTEGASREQALDRMAKALRRTGNKARHRG